MKKHKLEQTIIQTENLMTKIHNNNKIQQINERNERKLLKSFLILLTIIITSLYGLAVKFSLQYKGSAINQEEFIELKNIFMSKYYCNQVYFVNNYKLQDQILLQDLRGCISYLHYYEENITEFSNAIHKCAVIRSQDMIDEFIRYQKVQFLAFEASNDTLIISQIQQKIAEYELQNLRSISWEYVNGKQYAIIQYKKTFQVNDRGYYIGNEDKKIHEQFNYSQIFNNQLIEFYKKEQAKNILDLGCGLCNYIINIKNAGLQAEGYDGNPYTPQLTSGFGKIFDLTKRHDLQKKFDWVQSFQVGQHIPPSKTYIYIQNMVRHARKGIIISWGILGQKGLFHVNTKKNENVIKIFQSYNYTFDKQSTTQFRQKNREPWVKTNLLIFRKK